MSGNPTSRCQPSRHLVVGNFDTNNMQRITPKNNMKMANKETKTGSNEPLWYDFRPSCRYDHRYDPNRLPVIRF